MPAGREVTKGQLDDALGTALVELNLSIRRLREIKEFVDGKTDQELVDLGYSAPEVAAVKSALADMGQLAQIYAGNANLTNAKDFRNFARRLWGLGTS